MKKLTLFLCLVAFSFSLRAQKMTEVMEMWESVIQIEKPAFGFYHSDKLMLTELKQRCSKADLEPYPQMQILLDSMKVHVDFIQQERRGVDQDKVLIEKSLDSNGKIPKNSEAAKVAKNLKSRYDDLLKKLYAEQKNVEQYHTQFENLKMLHRISIQTFDQYNVQFIKEMHSFEDELVAQGSAIAKRKGQFANKRSEMTTEAVAAEQLIIDELEEIYKLTDGKILQVRNFQDRIQANEGEEIIYFGPGIALPYILQSLSSEMESLVSMIDSFKMLCNE